MATETVTLTGRAVFGIAGPKFHGLLSSVVPVDVKLGRNPPTEVSKSPKLSQFFSTVGYVAPPSLDYYSKAMPSLDRMYANDQYGCCVISGKAHNVGVYTAHDTDSEGLVLCTDQEIVGEYQRICGRGDNGCNIDHVLRTMMTGGIRQGGKIRKIDGYARINWMNPDEVKAALHIFGAITIGFYLPNSWTGTDVWDITNSRIIGGHDVSVVGWKENGNYVISSWGRLYEWTPQAFHSRQYIDEAYVILAPEWYNSDKVSPSRVDVAGLRKALDDFAAGRIPDVIKPEPTPEPEPQPEPVPPPPPTKYAVTMTGNFPSGIWGKTVPVTMTGTAVPTTSETIAPEFTAFRGGTAFAAGGDGYVYRIDLDTFREKTMSDSNMMVCLGSDNVAVPWDQISALLGKIIPVILAGVSAGKSAGEILEDVLKVLTETRKMAEKGRERILTPEQWAKIFDFVIKILPLFL